MQTLAKKLLELDKCAKKKIAKLLVGLKNVAKINLDIRRIEKMWQKLT